MNVNISQDVAPRPCRARSTPVTRETKLEHIWLKSYPKGVPAHIALDDLGSIGAFFERSVSQYPQRPAFISGATGRSLSYLELDLLSARFAGHLQSLGLPPGARIG